MSISNLEADLNIISALDDEPNDVGGLTAAELKAKFDESGNIVKTYLNGTLIPCTEEYIREKSAEMALGQIPDGTVTKPKLSSVLQAEFAETAAAFKRKFLSHMFTVPGSQVFTVPANMTSGDVVILGGGASGGTSPTGNSNNGGGGGSGYMTVLNGRRFSPGDLVPVVVGAPSPAPDIAVGVMNAGNLSSFDGVAANGGDNNGEGGSGGGYFTSTVKSAQGGTNGGPGGFYTTSTNTTILRMGQGATMRNANDLNGYYGGGGASGGDLSSLGGKGFMGRGGASCSATSNGNNATGFGNGGGGSGKGGYKGGTGSGGAVLIYTADVISVSRPLANFAEAVGVTAETSHVVSTGAAWEAAGCFSDFGINPVSGSLSMSARASNLASNSAFGLSLDPTGIDYADVDYGFVISASGVTVRDASGAGTVLGAPLTTNVYKVAYEGGRFVFSKNGGAVYTSADIALAGSLTCVITFGGAGGELSDIKWSGEAT